MRQQESNAQTGGTATEELRCPCCRRLHGVASERNYRVSIVKQHMAIQVVCHKCRGVFYIKSLVIRQELVYGGKKSEGNEDADGRADSWV